MKRLSAVASLVALGNLYAPIAALAQPPCTDGSPLSGQVRDTTAAIIPGASIRLDGRAPILADSAGRFRFACLGAGRHALHVAADSFATLDLAVNAPRQGELVITLHPQKVETTVDVGADSDYIDENSATASGPSQTISGRRLQSLADDPDDLLRELQQMAASAGGSPSNTSISVDGFQGGDNNNTLPPKSSIAYIKVNPDLFSAEYRQPPFGGGQVEIYTKPGQHTFHGALFATNGSPWMNARDPFSSSRAAIGKQRYGGELSGPIHGKSSDFTLTLEHRSIDNFAVVNAVTSLDASGNPVYTVANVPTPQRLWIGMARTDWQLGAKDTFIASYSANNNHLENVGVGGTALAETGYESDRYDNFLRLTNITTISAKLMHETRVGIEFDGETDIANSIAPQIQVAGAFTGGGASIGNARRHEIYTEIDDDAILSTTKHLLKFGIQNEILSESPRLTTNFNGTYIFGGGTLPGTSTPISGLQQYQLALGNQPGGVPTAFSNVAGNPNINIGLVRIALFVQDSWKLLPNLQVAYGLRYFTQTDPTILNNFTPRLGVSWSPDKKSTWTVHAHAGLFTGRFLARNWYQILGMDGVERVTSTVYNPSAYCPSGVATSCTPFAGATVVQSIRTVQPNLPNLFYGIENLGITHAFPHGWSLSGDYYIAQMWHYTRTGNINSPADGSPTGPRPLAPNLNIFQMQGTGRGYGNVEFMGLDQHALKRLQFSAGAVRVDIVDDTDDNPFFTPQTSGVNTGEYARRDGNPLWNVFANATLTLPAKLQLSGNFNASGATAYDITTGQDNNGDGDFNDRPQYALPGTPGAVQTPWGLLVDSGSAGATLPRNKGQMPWTFYLDTNLQRTFNLTKDLKANHPMALIANIRSSNILNHENVTQVGGVLGSPLFGVPYQADNGRRVEAGLRYSF
jgi:Carboxypeptidase regulatory-like domain